MKAIYQKLNNIGSEYKHMHVLVKNGEIQTDKHDFVTPMRPYNNMTKVSLAFIKKNFEQPRKL